MKHKTHKTMEEQKTGQTWLKKKIVAEGGGDTLVGRRVTLGEN